MRKDNITGFLSYKITHTLINFLSIINKKNYEEHKECEKCMTTNVYINIITLTPFTNNKN